MVRATLMDLRERITAVVSLGSSCRVAARHFGVGESTAIGLKKRYFVDGDIAPKWGSRLDSGKLEGVRGSILRAVEAGPDLTLQEISVVILKEEVQSPPITG